MLLMGCRTGPDLPRLDIAERATWEAEPRIRATGLTPGATYTLELARVSPWNPDASELASLDYLADGRGRIDTRAQGPVELDGEAFDALSVDDALLPYLPFQEMDYNRDPLEGVPSGRLVVTLRDGDGTEVLGRTVAMGPDRSALVEEPFGEDFPGAFLLRPASAAGPLPVVVALGGSEGDDGSARNHAPHVAERGFAVLGLPYHSPGWRGEPKFPDLPADFAHLPIDYLEAAVAELRTRDGIDPDRVSITGVSKGGEYVLLAASLIPDTSPGGGFCAVVADVPSDVVWEGWGEAPEGVEEGERFAGFSWRGEGLPFVPYANIGRGIDPNDPYTLAQSHAEGRAANPDRVAPARIRVEAIDEPVFAVGGDADTVWPSGEMVRNVARTREAAGLPTQSYTYADATHGALGDPLEAGRTADLAARLESWPAMMAFLDRHARRRGCRG